MSFPSASAQNPSASSLRVLTYALAAAPVFITVAVYFVLGLPGGPDAVALASLGLVVVGAVVAETFGFAVPAIPAGGEHDPQHVAQESVAAFQAAAIRRFVAIEAPFILSLALGFSFSETAWPVLLTAVPTVLLVLLEVSPSRRNADRTAARLERDGSPSYLHQGLGLA